VNRGFSAERRVNTKAGIWEILRDERSTVVIPTLIRRIQV